MTRLFLEITTRNRTYLYLVEPIDAHPQVATKAWRLRIGKRVYDVAINQQGWLECSCPDATFRNPGACKHIRGLRALGLLPRGK